MKEKPKICIVGMGYIGLPTAALLASNGHYVHGVDVNQNAVNKINKGQVHIVEPDLDDYVSNAVNNGYLKASTEPVESDVFMIAVPTPFHTNKLNTKTNSPIPNIDYILNALKKITPYIRNGNLILLESTSPIGTTNMVAELLQKEEIDLDQVYVAYSPERVLPGKIMKELIHNDRVIGGINEKSTKIAAKFYKSFVKGKVAKTTAKTAEMVKLAENSYRDVNIAFANELSMLCDMQDIDTKELIRLANRHPRVGILEPGCGVGGHCISVDPWFLVDTGNGIAKIIEQARRTNDFKPIWVLEKIKKHIAEFKIKNNKEPSIACMGLSFKPNIDDLRESPALFIAEELNKSFKIQAVEPNIRDHESIELIDLDDGLSKDICIYLVSHKEFDGIKVKENDLIFYGGSK